jgi:hypothetical protein
VCMYVYDTLVMVSAVIVETRIMCIYVQCTVQLLSVNPLCSYSGNLKNMYFILL